VIIGSEAHLKNAFLPKLLEVDRDKFACEIKL